MSGFVTQDIRAIPDGTADAQAPAVPFEMYGDRQQDNVEVGGPLTFLSRDEVIHADDVVVKNLYVPEWKGWVRVRSLMGAERDALEESTIVERKDGKRTQNLANFRARMIARCLIDEQNQLLFTERDVLVLGRKNASALDAIFTVARDLSGMTARDVEDLLGNSAPDPSGDSGSS